ncbi:MAG: DUF1467 family protein [Pseudomonadota bacterium]
MSITSALVLYAVIWALVFYMVSPFGQTTQREAGEVVPGTPESAPVEQRLRRKALITTGIACVAFVLVYAVVEFRLLTLEQLSWITPPSLQDGAE